MQAPSERDRQVIDLAADPYVLMTVQKGDLLLLDGIVLYVDRISTLLSQPFIECLVLTTSDSRPEEYDQACTAAGGLYDDPVVNVPYDQYFKHLRRKSDYDAIIRREEMIEMLLTGDYKIF